MGRKSGVSAGETKSRLLRSAALVFARRGFSGATIAEIASEADLSSGSIYAHYAGKSDLFLAVLEAHGRAEIGRSHGDVTEYDISLISFERDRTWTSARSPSERW